VRPAIELDLPLAVDRMADQPLHAQIAGGLRSAAVEGLLTAGTRLPSSRTLATRLGVARGTVLAAYEQLEGEGQLERRHGSGVYLADNLKPQPLPPKLSTVPSSGQAVAGFHRSQQPGLDLRPGQPNTRQLIDPAWRRAWKEAAACLPPTAPERQGLLALRQQISAHLAAARGLACEPSQVFVTAGTDDALSLLVHALELAGKPVAVEDPGYPSARQLLARLGAHVIPVPVDADGLVLDRLVEVQQPARLVLVTPSHQYPLGGRLPLHRRLSLLAWAHQHDVIVAEDDYDGEFRYDVAPLPALASLDSAGRVVHLGTFSKSLTPWLRTGFLVAPPWLAGALLDVREDLGSPVDGVTQSALAAYMATGALRRHIARTRRDYARARQRLTELLAAHAPLVTLGGLDAGLHAVLDLPPGTDTEALTRQLAAEGVTVADLSEYAVADAIARDRPALVIGYGNASPLQLEHAVRLVMRSLRSDRPGTQRGAPQACK